MADCSHRAKNREGGQKSSMCNEEEKQWHQKIILRQP